jgi:hypothetical protein
MVEIKELVVRASVNESPLDPHAKAESGKTSERAAGTREEQDKEIIESCVRQVLAILERQRER